MMLSRLTLAAAAFVALLPKAAPAQGKLVNPVFSGGGGFSAGAGIQVFSTIGQPASGLAFNDRFRHGVGLGYLVDTSLFLNNPPVADAGEDQTLTCANHHGAEVTLDGSGSTDTDGDVLSFTWTTTDGNVLAGPAGESTAGVQLGAGTHIITLTVDDGRGGRDTDDVAVIIKDDMPPEVTASLERISGSDEDSNKIEGVFTVECAATDACDANPTLLAVISLPILENPSISFKKARVKKLEIKPAKNKIEVKGPDPQSFWSEIEQNAGIAVENGGSLNVEVKAGTQRYEYKFNREGHLTSIEAPGVVLRCQGTDASGNTAEAETGMVADGPSKMGVIQFVTGIETPSEYRLDQNYPNPFNPTTTIRFHLPEPVDVRIQVFDMLGRQIATLASGAYGAGVYNAVWDGRGGDGIGVVSGVYIVRIEAASFTQTRLMTLLK